MAFILDVQVLLFQPQTIADLVKDNSLSDQNKWEYLRYKVRNFTVVFSKGLDKNPGTRQKELEQKITRLEQDLSTEENFDEYMSTKNKLKEIL